MRIYILKRILLFIPGLIIISFFAFTISVNAPGDPVDRLISGSLPGNEASGQYYNQAEQRKYWRKKLGLDFPLFYFSLKSIAEPDTLYKIENTNEQLAMKRLLSEYGNWKEISQYYLTLKKSQESLIKKMAHAGTTKITEHLQPYSAFASLASVYNEKIVLQRLQSLKQAFADLPECAEEINRVAGNFNTLITTKTPWKNYVPSFSFHSSNQYHHWLFGDGIYSKGIIRGDFGVSYSTRQPVWQLIKGKIKWSLFFTLISVLLAYVISIPLGSIAAWKRNSAFDRFSSLLLFTLYSLPVFWIATLVIMLFANPDVLKIFPASGVMPVSGYPEGAGIFEKIRLSLPYLVLPTFCYAYSSVAFLSRTVRVSMLEQLGEDYTRTARAKGLTERQVIFRHALRNSLLPVITLFANVFPLAVGGSVILETIFTIPGIGYETVFAIQNQNHPLIIAIFMITGFLTMTGYLVADILYAFADPRIAYK